MIVVVVDEVEDEVGGRISVDPIGIVIHFWILEARQISDLILRLPATFATETIHCSLLT